MSLTPTPRVHGHVRRTESIIDDLRPLIKEQRVALLLSREVRALPAVSHLVESICGLVNSGSHETRATVIEVSDGESQKDFESVELVTESLGRERFPRDGILIAIGGGATTDLAGFVASIWMRGVEWIAVPTTLAGMVDAAIGGKTGINLSSGKNLVGAFHLPIVTLIDQRFLSTLPSRDVSAGLAEVIKCGFISDPGILDLAESISEAELKDPGASSVIGELVMRSAAVKESIVGSDLKERGQRAFLNYGHTLGHAIEIAERLTLRHGEAVSIGMVFAAELSKRIHGLDEQFVQRHRTILDRFGLPLAYSGADFDSLWEIMTRDKKVSSGRMRFVTLSAIGSPTLTDDVPRELARVVFEYSIGRD